jgi:hypothetical protein
LQKSDPSQGGQYADDDAEYEITFENVPPPLYLRRGGPPDPGQPPQAPNSPSDPPQVPDDPSDPPSSQLPIDKTDPFTFYVVTRRFSTPNDATRFQGFAMYGRDAVCSSLSTHPNDFTVVPDFYVMDDPNDKALPDLLTLNTDISKVHQLNLKGSSNLHTKPCGLDTTYVFIKRNETRWGPYAPTFITKK